MRRTPPLLFGPDCFPAVSPGTVDTLQGSTHPNR